MLSVSFVPMGTSLHKAFSLHISDILSPRCDIPPLPLVAEEGFLFLPIVLFLIPQFSLLQHSWKNSYGDKSVLPTHGSYSSQKCSFSVAAAINVIA